MSEDLEETVKDLEARLDDAVFLAKRAEERVDDLEEELYEKDERIRDRSTVSRNVRRASE
jgi:hypothetical protein